MADLELLAVAVTIFNDAENENGDLKKLQLYREAAGTVLNALHNATDAIGSVIRSKALELEEETSMALHLATSIQ